jgi:hypothetical protein
MKGEHRLLAWNFSEIKEKHILLLIIPNYSFDTAIPSQKCGRGNLNKLVNMLEAIFQIEECGLSGTIGNVGASLTPAPSMRDTSLFPS